ncbi:MAG: hypothetical protein JO337_00195 [Acidimicrobiales bacterium]|nr:hypothetical protein [Acidimicrobiales bacterium]
MTTPPRELPTAWAVLARALTERRSVRARYHERERLLCPHLLGWKNGRPKVLAYQTTASPPTHHDDRGWRSLFVDEIQVATIEPDHPWQTAEDYSTASNSVNEIAMAIPPE